MKVARLFGALASAAVWHGFLYFESRLVNLRHFCQWIRYVRSKTEEMKGTRGEHEGRNGECGKPEARHRKYSSSHKLVNNDLAAEQLVRTVDTEL